jgi:hypothetical protein
METAPSTIMQAFNAAAYSKPTFMGEFFSHCTIDQGETQRFGVNVYQSKTYIRIKTKGRKDNTVRVATDEDKALFKEAWAKFESNRQDSGIPLVALPGWSATNEATLADLGIKTVEQLLVYTERLAWHTLRVMQHAGLYLMNGLAEYIPPEEEPDDAAQRPQEQEVPLRNNVEAPGYGQGLRENTPLPHQNGGQAQSRVGVSLDEKGEVISIEGRQEESRQEEIVQEKVVPSPWANADPLEGMVA